MRSALPILAVIQLVSAGAPLGAEVQTDWSGGGGQAGPVLLWDDAYEAATDVSALAIPGQVGLTGTAYALPPGQLVENGFPGSFGIAGADLDGDGDTDIVGTVDASGDVAVWYHDGADPPGWNKQVVDSTFLGASGLGVADLNGDGRPDLVANTVSANQVLACWLNGGGSPVSWTKQVIDLNGPRAFELSLADVDLNGTPDVLAPTWDGGGEVAWWANDGGAPITWTKHVVDNTLDGAHSIQAGDLDGDGDMDLAVAAGEADQIVWYRNDGGSPFTWTKHVIRLWYDGARSVAIADLDGDGDFDLAGTCWNQHVSWWRNDGGDPLAWTEQHLSEAFAGGHAIRVADLDGDGRRDVLASAFLDHDVKWWRNGGGNPIVWTENVVRDGYTSVIEIGVADVNGDGGLDVLGTSYNTGRFKWWEPVWFAPSGELTSSILDTGTGVAVATLDWTSIEPTGTDVRFEVRSSNDAEDLGSWSSEIASPGSLGDLDRYVQYRVRLSTTDSTRAPVLEDVALGSSVTGVGQLPAASGVGALVSRPNPGRPDVTLSFSLTSPGRVRLTIYDVAGRAVARLADRVYGAGAHAVIWRGRGDGDRPLPTGTYLARLESPAGRSTRKLQLLR